jgi:heme/copper-type cytochrome/quinol oxidase subunit 2
MKRRGIALITLGVLVMAALPIVASAAGKTLTTATNVKEVFVKVDLDKSGFQPSEITVHEGQKVIFDLVAKDAEHGFRIDAYKIDKIVKPNKAETFTIEADKTGTFPVTSPLPADKNLKGELKVLSSSK